MHAQMSRNQSGTEKDDRLLLRKQWMLLFSIQDGALKKCRSSLFGKLSSLIYFKILINNYLKKKMDFSNFTKERKTIHHF